MPQSESFRTLKVWRDAMTFVEEVYRSSQRFPIEERFGLIAQIRRAAVSIPSNIAEGSRRRRYPRVRMRHLSIALGSQGEIEVHLELALRLRFLEATECRRLQLRAEEIGRMLNGLIASAERELQRQAVNR